MAKIIKYVILLLILLLSADTISGCGLSYRGKNKPKPSELNVEMLISKYSNYSSWAKEREDGNGFIYVDACDSLMLSSLANFGTPFDIRSARAADGKWLRRPMYYPECYKSGGSSSTISRDMLLGVMTYAKSTDDLELLTSMWEYGKSHSWVMGEGDPTRTAFTPGMRKLLAFAIRNLGGEYDNTYEMIPDVYTLLNRGFTAHLDVLYIDLRGEVTGKITDMELKVLKFQHERIPLNAYYAYAYHRYSDGNMADVLEILLNSPLFPNDSLPGPGNYCTDWLWSRDPGADYEPCKMAISGIKYPAGEFRFVAAKVIRAARGR